MIRLTSFLWVWFQCVFPLIPSCNTYRLGFLLPWAWGISSRLLQQSAAIAPYLGRGVSPHCRPSWPSTWDSSTVEVRNRFKGLDLIECLINYGMRFMTLYRRQGSRPSPWKRNAKKAKWLSGEALQIAVKRREVKSKGENERFWNAEFQRIEKREWRTKTKTKLIKIFLTIVLFNPVPSLTLLYSF